ncbi:hypothetical protein BH11ARM1_BH11ARM1_13120 [soil metagenome]
MNHKTIGMAMAMIGGLTLIPQQAKADFDLGRMAETVGTMVIADRLGIDPGIALAASIATNQSVYGLAPVYALTPYTTTSPVVIYEQRRRGYTWQKICTVNRVPVSTYNTLYRNHQFEDDYVWQDEFSNRYGVPVVRLQRLRHSGYSWPEISQGIVVCQRGGWVLEDVLFNHRRHNYWGRPGWAYAVSSSNPYIVPVRTYRSSYLPVAVYHRINWQSPYQTLYSSIWKNQRAPISVHWARQSIVRSPRTVIINNRKTVINYRPIIINTNKPVKIITNGHVRYAKAQTRVGSATIWKVKPGTTIRVGSTTITTPNRRAQPIVKRPNQKPPVKRPNWPAHKPHPPIRPGYMDHKPAPKPPVHKGKPPVKKPPVHKGNIPVRKPPVHKGNPPVKHAPPKVTVRTTKTVTVKHSPAKKAPAHKPQPKKQKHNGQR